MSLVLFAAQIILHCLVAGPPLHRKEAADRRKSAPAGVFRHHDSPKLCTAVSSLQSLASGVWLPRLYKTTLLTWLIRRVRRCWRGSLGEFAAADVAH
jgi:hypothetical protein